MSTTLTECRDRHGNPTRRTPTCEHTQPPREELLASGRLWEQQHQLDKDGTAAYFSRYAAEHPEWCGPTGGASR